MENSKNLNPTFQARKLIAEQNTMPETPNSPQPSPGGAGYPFWPEIPNNEKSNSYALHAQLLFTQWMAPETFQSYQMRQLENLLRFAGQNSPFYRDSLKFLEKLPKHGLYEQHLAYIPVMNGRDLQANGQKIIVRQPLPNHGKSRMIRISKPTGPPVRMMTTGLVDAWDLALELRSQDWHGTDVSLANLDILEPVKQEIHAAGHWSLLPWSGPLSALSIDRPVEDLFEEFIRVGPDYLRTLPGILQSFVELSLSRGLKPQNLCQVRCRSDYLSPELRELVEKTWGVQVIHEYFVKEIGVIAEQCRENHTLHVHSEFVRVEILGDDNNPCRAGQSGRIVVTPLQNHQTPLIRYDTGNYAEVGEPCGCGRTLPALVVTS
jgi:phenylacetate-CoA ligase